MENRQIFTPKVKLKYPLTSIPLYFVYTLSVTGKIVYCQKYSFVTGRSNPNNNIFGVYSTFNDTPLGINLLTLKRDDKYR